MNSLGEEFRQSTTDSPVFGASAGRSKGSILEPSTGSFTHLPGNWWRLLARGLSSCAYEPVWASSGSKGKHLKSQAEPTSKVTKHHFYYTLLVEAVEKSHSVSREGKRDFVSWWWAGKILQEHLPQCEECFSVRECLSKNLTVGEGRAHLRT